MNTQQLYSQYPIPLNLQIHMLTVAAVSHHIGEHFNISIDLHTLTLAGLIHDLGNLIKFNLDDFGHLLQDGTVEEWKAKQKQMIQKYGPDEHQATLAIGQEASLSPKVIALLPQLGSSHLQDALDGNNWEQKISIYSDMRVAPSGLVTVDERFDDARRRYSHKGIENINQCHQLTLQLEQQIQTQCSIQLNQIDPKIISQRANTLLEFRL